MVPLRTSKAPQPSNINTVYTLSLLSEYTHTLDSLPLDLSRNLADLRELDAVLSSSMASITMKIQRLTQVIERGALSKQERLFLLTEIAEEASRLKLGGEDKIRVACQAADNLKGHVTHMRTLLSFIPSFDMSVLHRKTTYPHIAPRSYMPIMENSRRKRGNYSSIMSSGHDSSPNKRKRNPRDDDIDVAGVKSPRKDRNGEAGPSRLRNGVRPERAASPTESVLSVTSHTVNALPQSHPGNSRAAGGSSRSGNVSNKRAKGHDGQTPNGSTSRRDIFPPPPSTSAHPSLSTPYANNSNGVHKYDVSAGNPNDWVGPPPHGQLEGPGVPVARSTHTNMSATPMTSNPLGARDAQSASVAADTATEAGEGDGEGDDRTYCFCDGISYGEMIACDDEHCEREWFHLACIGLTVPPEGTWFCDACRGTKQRNAKRGARGNRKRVGAAGNARSGGKNTNQ
ncbi:hypothetical protein ID866_2846 [Astraeus odoratus]|nr:hypothetical protein ID866_2846 [Astraeus odoratus]